MPRTCCIVGCKTGYKSNQSRVSTFSFPTNTILREKWINIIPHKDFILSNNSAVCANHFTDDQIIRTRISGVGDKQLCINFKYPKLKKDAIPTIFPSPKYLYNPRIKRNSHNKQDCTLISSGNIKLVKVKSKISDYPCYDDRDPEFVQSLILTTEQKFKSICCELESTELPDNWKYVIHLGKRPYVVLYTIKCKNYESEIIIEKQIILDSDMIMKFKIFNTNISLQNLCQNSNISSLRELISILIIINSKKVCAGGPLIQEFEGISIKCANIIAQKHWQHKKCPYLIDISCIKCSFCEALRSIFHMKISRLSFRKSTKLLISLTKKNGWKSIAIKNIVPCN